MKTQQMLTRQVRPKRALGRKLEASTASRLLNTTRNRLAARDATRRRYVRRKLSRQLQSRLAIARPQLSSVYSGAHALSLWLLVACAWALYLFATADPFFVGAVLVTGNANVPADEIALASHAANQNVFYLDFDQLTAQVRAVSGVRDVSIAYELPNVLHLNVIERAPLFVWQSGARSAWVDDSGLLFKARGALANALTVSDLDGQPRTVLDAAVLTGVRALAAALPAVKHLDYSDARGFVFVDEHHWRVLFGPPDQVNAKLAMLRTLTSYLLAQKIDVDYLDVRLPDRAFFKPK